MDLGYVVGASFGGAAASSLIVFPVVALAAQGQKKAKLRWANGLLYFALTVILGTVANFVLYELKPSLLSSTETGVLGYVRLFGVPLVSSLLVLMLLWHPTPSSAKAK
jgi:drug/metabolite transporter (DMT)-like permease